MRRPGIRRWLTLPLTRRAIREQEVDREIEFHIRSRAERLAAEGMSPAEALSEARRRFGGSQIRVELLHEAEHREVRLGLMDRIADIRRDLSFATRNLKRRWAFALTAVLTLSLGIASTTSVFAVINGVLLRPPPYRDPDQLITLYTVFPQWRGQPGVGAEWNTTRTPYPDFLRFRANQSSFSDVAAFDVGTMAFADAGESEMIQVGHTTPELLRVLGVTPQRGRWFVSGEEGTNSPPVVVLSDQMWRTRFGGRDDVLGRTITLNDKTYRIVGVLRRGFDFTRSNSAGLTARPELWAPLGSDGSVFYPNSFDFEVIGRLKNDASLAAATSEADRLLRGTDDPVKRGLRAVRRTDVEVGQFRTPLLLLGAAVGILLLITCANVAALFLGESAGREPELKIRVALGAGRARLLRLLLMESWVLAATGGVVGVGLGWAATRVLLSLAPVELPHAGIVRFDPRVAVFVVGISIMAALVSGILPALLSASSVSDVGAAGSRATRRGTSAQLAITASQAALSVVMLGGAGLLARSLANQASVNPGFDTSNLLTMRVYLPSALMVNNATRLRAHEALAKDLATLPGVERVTASYGPPFAGRVSNLAISTDAAAALTSASPTAERQVVFANYFDVMRIPIVAGRTFHESDDAESGRVVIISEAMAKRFWPGRNVIGLPLRYPTGVATIVGVAADVRNKTLTQQAGATFYLPATQEGARLTMILRTRSAPSSVLPAARSQIWKSIPGSTVAEASTMNELMAADLADARYRSVLAAAFAAMAILITTVGVGGLAARGISARMKELCVRIAVGATPASAVATGVRKGMLAVVGGATLGLAVMPFALRPLRDYLFMVPTGDAVTMAAATLMMVVAASMASMLAARRMFSVDLSAVLRGD